MNTFAVIIPAAGRSTRFGGNGRNKLFAELEGRTVCRRAVEAFAQRDDVGQIILAVGNDDKERFEHEAQGLSKQLTIVAGGAERVDSIRCGLAAVVPRHNFVAVHDAARPCVSAELINRVFLAAVEYGAAIPGVAVVDTLKRVDSDGRVAGTVARLGLFAVQTPQAFRRDWFEQAYTRPVDALIPTDDAQRLEALGLPCQVVEGSAWNIKITQFEDLALAQAILRAQATLARGD
jgi:2-C-methyl-D-erythritol 4-phosphate cytidylyltransferase